MRQRPPGPGCLARVASAGIAVPTAMAVVGYDDVAFASMLSPALTSVRQPKYDLGVAAAQLLLEEVAALPHEHRAIRFEPELVVRASSSSSPLVPSEHPQPLTEPAVSIPRSVRSIGNSRGAGARLARRRRGLARSSDRAECQEVCSGCSLRWPPSRWPPSRWPHGGGPQWPLALAALALAALALAVRLWVALG